jgi:hypothetical protein
LTLDGKKEAQGADRQPADIPAFNRAMISLYSRSVAALRH